MTDTFQGLKAKESKKAVEIEVKRIKQGLKITRFETKILDKQEKRLTVLRYRLWMLIMTMRFLMR
ncbi:MAG: hypothetical protein LWW98_06460 [Deltaproteobacteria bacterium]|nr:hypothetical protein [Deltaproteobacteria bacterium]